jgi:hypothetical protein
MRIRTAINLTMLLGLVFAGLAVAQKPQESEAFLELRTANGSSQYQIGEIIPLQLIFTTSIPGKYKVNKASYDRSGRLSLDRFDVSPSTGWSDPLETYYKSFTAFMMGGLFGEDDLTNKPVIVEDKLNEWVRFDKPGEYTVKVSSTRAHQKVADSISEPEISSNSITLKIVTPDRAWQERMFSAAVQAFDSKQNAKSYMDDRDAKMKAIDTLSFLGTTEAAEKLASLIRGTDLDGNLMIGLIGTPHRAEVVRRMKELLQDPEFPVTGTFLTAIAVLEEGSDGDAKMRERLEDMHREELKKYVGQKTGEARTTTLKTIQRQ